MKERLIKLIQAENLTYGKLAEIAGVQPSAISHIISGRNKPSFDFISNLLAFFPKLNSRWLLLGEGEMYDSNTDPDSTPDETETNVYSTIVPETEPVRLSDEPLSSSSNELKKEKATNGNLDNSEIQTPYKKTVAENKNINQNDPNGTDGVDSGNLNQERISPKNRHPEYLIDDFEEIERVIIFYRNGKFKLYQNR